MIDTEKIKKIAEEKTAGSELFVIGVTCSPSNEVEVVIDSDGSVDLDSCVSLSSAIEGQMNREDEDFALTVISAGVGMPLKVYRQYRKLVGGKVEVVLADGTKILATLSAATEDSITLSYTEMRSEAGKKRKTPVEVVETYPLAQVKSTVEYLDFK